MENAVALFGSFDENIKEIEKAYGVNILCRGTQIKISGDPEKVSLAGKAVAVCGSEAERHGIVLAKSEKAKKAGITTGMVTWQARQKCPQTRHRKRQRRISCKQFSFLFKI